MVMLCKSNLEKTWQFPLCPAPVPLVGGNYSINIVGNVVEWLRRRAYVQRSVGLKPTRAFLLCLGKNTLRHFSLLSSLGK